MHFLNNMYNINKIIKYVEKKYKEKPEYLWKKFPDFAVFRHKDNRKWFMLLAKVDKTKLSMDIDYKEKLQNEVEIMNVKCDPNMIDAIVNNKNLIRSYHMNKKHWITVILDGSLKDSNINELIDISFGMTCKKNKK